MASRFGTGSTRGRRQTDDTPLSDAPIAKAMLRPGKPAPTARALRDSFKGGPPPKPYQKPKPSAQALRDSFGKGLLSTAKVAEHGKLSQRAQLLSESAKNTSNNAANHAHALRKMKRPSEAAERDAFSQEMLERGRVQQASSNDHAVSSVKEAKKVRAKALGVGGASGIAVGAGATAALKRKREPERRKMKVYKSVSTYNRHVDKPATFQGRPKGAPIPKDYAGWGLRAMAGQKNKQLAAGGVGAAALIGGAATAIHHKRNSNIPAGAKKGAKLSKAEVSKTRSFDPEHRRQQKLGAATAALAAGGGYAAFRGGRGILATSKHARRATGVESKAVGRPHEKADANRKLLHAVKSGVTGTKGDFAMVGGGAAGLGGAAGVQVHANSRRGKAWD